MESWVWIATALLAVLTLAQVYRGGTTLNDHAVAVVVLGCLLIYPTLGEGALSAGVQGFAWEVLSIVLVLGALGIYGLFHVLGRKRDPGWLIWWGRWSQPCYAFSLWTGLLLLLRSPLALALDWPLLWPGWGLLLPLGLAGWGTIWTYTRGARLVEYELPAPGLARSVRVAHLSDLHAGPVTPRSRLDALAEQVNGLKPDLVLVTGDLLMPFAEEEHGFLLDALGRIEAPVFCCAGNHDLPVLERLVEELEAVGAPLLVDESRAVRLGEDVVEVAGVNFHWRDARGELLAAIEGLPATSAGYRILMAHDPRLFGWVPEGRFDLVLSGHTHGGQVGTNMFGIPWSVLRMFGVYDQGFFHRGPSRLYVHSGNWFTGLPPRMGIAGEVAVHRLV